MAKHLSETARNLRADLRCVELGRNSWIGWSLGRGSLHDVPWASDTTANTPLPAGSS